MSSECPVCFELFDLKTRQPKTLSCHHNVCNECLTKLRRGDRVECPKCRSPTRTQDVGTNYGLTGVLEELCRECIREKHIGKCHHCGEFMCKNCMETHRTDSYSDLKKDVENLIDDWRNAAVRSSDQTPLQKEIRSEEDVIQQVKTLVQKHKDELDRLQANIIQKIKQISAANVRKHKDWTNSLACQIDECRSFTHTTQSTLGATCSDEHTTELLADLSREAKHLSTEMNEMQNKLPEITHYIYKMPESSTFDVGEIVCEPARVVDYTSVRSKAVAGKQGSGVSEFKNRARVCAMDDRIVVTDDDNNRVKVYDWELNVMCVIGEKGSGRYQFNYPAGVCDICTDIYVSDQLNHRIHLYNAEYKCVRMFGSRGSGKDQFDCPLGLAAGPGPLLYICDARNYRVKVVRPDGSYVRSIGCQGTGPGEFTEYVHRVAVTSHGVVLVTDSKLSNVYMFRTSGEYLRMLFDSIPHSINPITLRGITVDKDDNIILADYENHRVIVLTREGQYKCQIGVRGSQPGELDGPWDVAISRGGDLVVYETQNHRLQVFGA